MSEFLAIPEGKRLPPLPRASAPDTFPADKFGNASRSV
jgi:hypothetical protein